MSVDVQEVDHSGYYVSVTGSIGTLNEHTIDFHNNNDIYHNTCDNSSFHFELRNSLNPICEDSLTWKINGLELCVKSLYCEVNLTSADQIVEVYFGKTVVLKVNIRTYSKRPVVKFERGGGYDDAKDNDFRTLNHYEKLNIASFSPQF